MTPRGQEGTEDQAHGGKNQLEQPVPVLGWFWPRGRGLWGRYPAAWESSQQLFIASPAVGRGSRVFHRSSPLAVLPGCPDLESPTLGTDEVVKGNLRRGELQVPLCLGPSQVGHALFPPPLTRSLPLSLPSSSPGPGDLEPVSSGPSRAWRCHHHGQLGAGGSFPLTLPSPPPPPHADLGITIPAPGPGSRKAAKSASTQLLLIHLPAQPT